MFRKIVVATDLVGRSRRFENFASALAGRVGAKVLPTFVFKPPGGVYSFNHPSSELVSSMEASWRERLEAVVERVRRKGLKADGRFRTGHAASAIREIASEDGADLVITAKHQKSPLQGFLMGSHSEGIVREAGCPVLVLPEEFEEKARWGPVLCGVDFSKRSRSAMAYSIRLCESFGLDLVLAHAVEYQPGPPGLALDRASLVSDIEASAKEQLSEWARVAGAPASTQLVVQCAGAPDLMVTQATKVGAGLIVIGKQGQIMRNGQGLGSTVGCVLRRAQIPVLVHQ